MQKHLQRILDFILPPRKGVLLMRGLSYGDFLDKSEPSPICDWALSPFSYRHDFNREILWELKYHANPKAISFFAKAIYEVLIEEIADDFMFSKKESCVLIPIPASNERKKKYGFNPPDLLVNEIIKLDENDIFESGSGVLKRIKDVPRQTDIKNKRERVANAKGVFGVSDKKALGRKVIVIDDVTTTGATLKDAKRALKEAGAKRVSLVAAAH